MSGWIAYVINRNKGRRKRSNKKINLLIAKQILKNKKESDKDE